MNTVDRIMELADTYAEEVAETPPRPTPLERALAVTKLEKARAALHTALQELTAERDAYQVAADKLAGELRDMQRQEPVRWMKETADGFSRYYEADETQPPGCTPLYAAPQPAQPVAQPLTFDQITELWEKALNNSERIYEIRIEAGIRYAEKHHGIEAKEHGTP